jgi:DNA-binding NarL/FixJ family response regulator
MDGGWKVIVADEIGITRRAIATAIRTSSVQHEVLECSTTEAALSLLGQVEATLLLVDLMSPGLELVEAARGRHPGLKIVVLAGYDRAGDALRSLQAGADGFLLKGMYPEELMTCLCCVVDTGVVVTSRVLKRALGGVHEHFDHADHGDHGADRGAERPEPVLLADGEVADCLTQREREIFDLMAQNYANKEIAAELHIAEQTVKAHVSRILTKLGQPNRAQAVIYGLRGRGSRPDSKVVSLRGARS